MSVDYKDEINKLIELVNKYALVLNPQNKPQLQISNNMIQQHQENTSQSMNVSFMLKGNDNQQLSTEDDQYQPKGTRPKMYSLKKGNLMNGQNSQGISQNESPIKTIQNNSSFLGKSQNSLPMTQIQQLPIKIVQDNKYLVKDILEQQNLQNKQKTKDDAIKIQDQQEFQEQNKQEILQKQQEKCIEIYPQYVYMDTDSGELQYQNQQYEQQIQNCAGQQQEYQTVDNLKEYGVDEIQIKSGGGGMIKKKKKYDYRFRDVNDLVQESESNAPFGMVEMRYTPRLYEKKQKLQTINEWKNERLISCEEDVLAKQDLIQAKKQNKRRLEEQIDMISQQQFQWEYIVSRQLHKFKVRNQNQQRENGNNLNEYRNILFQNDFDKRIHNLYIDEKLLRFTAEKQNQQQQLLNHKIHIQKERDRIRDLELRTTQDKLRNKQTSIQALATHINLTESPERLNTTNIQSDTIYKQTVSNGKLRKFNDTFIYENSQNDFNNNNLILTNVNSNTQINIQSITRQKRNSIDDQRASIEEAFMKNLIYSRQSQRIRDSVDSSTPNEQINKLFNHFQMVKGSQETIDQNNDRTNLYCTTGDTKNKESIESYLQKQILSQTKSRFPSIDRSPSITKRQPIPFSLSDQKQKQQDQLSPFKSYTKKLSVDNHLQRYYINNSSRYPSPQLNYHVQIDYPNKNRQLGVSQNQSRITNRSRKGFLNQTFIKY